MGPAWLLPPQWPRGRKKVLVTVLAPPGAQARLCSCDMRSVGSTVGLVMVGVAAALKKVCPLCRSLCLHSLSFPDFRGPDQLPARTWVLIC